MKFGDVFHEHGQLTPEIDSSGIGQLLRPERLLGVLKFGDPAVDEIDGRPCWRSGAHPIANAQRRGPLMMDLRHAGVDHTYWFDRATGMVLRHVGYIDGQACAIDQFSGLVVNEPIGKETFMLTAFEAGNIKRRLDLSLERAEKMGIDLSDVDRTDPDAIDRAMRETMRRGPLDQRIRPEIDRTKHVPVGPLPTNEAEARAGVEYAVTHYNEIAPDGTTLVNVQQGAHLARLLAKAGPRIPGWTGPGSVTIECDDVVFVRSDEGVAWFSLLIGGNRVLTRHEGRVLLVEGRWVLSHATLIDLVGLVGVTGRQDP